MTWFLSLIFLILIFGSSHLWMGQVFSLLTWEGCMTKHLSEQQLQSQKSLSFRSTPHPVTVTTRIITFLVGNPYKPSFATVTGWGVDPTYLVCKIFMIIICHDIICIFVGGSCPKPWCSSWLTNIRNRVPVARYSLERFPNLTFRFFISWWLNHIYLPKL